MVNWTGEPGQFEMETGYTLRAKELRDLYNALKMEGLNREERIDMLLTLKNIVAGVPDCKLTKELIGLAEREAEGHEIDDEERALMERALEENAVIVAQMTPFFGDELSDLDDEVPLH